MNFSIATQSPIAVTIGEERLLIPRFDIDDIEAFGAIIDGERREAATKDLPAIERARLFAFFEFHSAELNEIVAQAYTPRGSRHIVETCLKKCGKTEGQAKEISRRLDKFDRQALAVALASITEAPPNETDEEKPEESNDPLSDASDGSSGSPSTGAIMSPSSTPPIPESESAA